MSTVVGLLHLELNVAQAVTLKDKRRVIQSFKTRLSNGFNVSVAEVGGLESHRHAVLVDVETGGKYIPLKNLDEKQAYFCVYNSLLSEAAVLGFDYGYAMDYPVQRYLRDVRFTLIGGGTSEILKLIIAKETSS